MIDYSTSSTTGVYNHIYPGSAWSAEVAMTVAAGGADWTAADETASNWRLRIHGSRGGGTPEIASAAATAVRSVSDTVLTLTFSLAATDTDDLATTPDRAEVELERKQSDATWKPQVGMSGYVRIKGLPGAAS